MRLHSFIHSSLTVEQTDHAIQANNCGPAFSQHTSFSASPGAQAVHSKGWSAGTVFLIFMHIYLCIAGGFCVWNFRLFVRSERGASTHFTPGLLLTIHCLKWIVSTDFVKTLIGLFKPVTYRLVPYHSLPLLLSPCSSCNWRARTGQVLMLLWLTRLGAHPVTSYWGLLHSLILFSHHSFFTLAWSSGCT